jgi:hypothetical protein
MRAIARAMAVLFAWIRGVLTRFSGTGTQLSASDTASWQAPFPFFLPVFALTDGRFYRSLDE